jgi:hypothetical protein
MEVDYWSIFFQRVDKKRFHSIEKATKILDHFEINELRGMKSMTSFNTEIRSKYVKFFLFNVLSKKMSNSWKKCQTKISVFFLKKIVKTSNYSNC